MARRKGHDGAENHERWLVSYADFITLLFAFFVVMFASSQADKGKAAQVSESVKKALNSQNLPVAVAAILGGAVDNRGQGNAEMKGPGGDKKVTQTAPQMIELQSSMTVLTKELETEIRSGTLEITMEARGLTLSFRQAALFPSGGDEISTESYPAVAKVAEAIKKIPNPVRLEGHTDSVPIHNARFRSNWELSAARSVALLSLLTERFGVSNSHVSIAGYADTAPLADNDSDEGRSRNRRVDIVILNETGLKGEPQAYRAAK